MSPLDGEVTARRQESANDWVNRHQPVDPAYFDVRLPASTWWRLTALAEAAGCSVAELVDELVKEAS